MQRRSFTHTLLAAAALTTPATRALAFSAGSDYRVLPARVPTQVKPGQIEVLEFFSYSCIHCFNFEAPLHAWTQKQPADVVFKRIPVLFSAQFEPIAKLYYSLEALGWLPQLHLKVFRAIHVDKQRLYTDAAIAQWMGAQNVDMAAFKAMYASFGIVGKLKRSAQLSAQFEVEGTPALGINGRYSIPGQGERTLAIADSLIAQLRRA